MSIESVRGPWNKVDEVFVDDTDGHTVCTPYGMNKEERIARANLIAAAPELYEVLRGIACANQKDWDETLRSAENFKRWAQSIANHVVNKAEGL